MTGPKISHFQDFTVSAESEKARFWKILNTLYQDNSFQKESYNFSLAMSAEGPSVIQIEPLSYSAVNAAV